MKFEDLQNWFIGADKWAVKIAPSAMMTLLVQSEVELVCQLLDLEYVVDEPDRKALQMRFFGEHRIETDLIVERNIKSGIRLDVAGCELLDGVDPALAID